MGDSAVPGGACYSLQIEPLELEQLMAGRGLELVEANWQERLGPGESDVDWHQYRLLDASGMLVLVGALLNGELVAYAAAAVMPGLNSRKVQCQGLVIYVTPEQRGKNIAPELILALSNAARLRDDMQGRPVRWNVEVGDPLAALLERSGYRLTEEVYTR